MLFCHALAHIIFKLEKRLQDEKLQRQREEENYVIKTTELTKLITEKEDSLVQLNQKVISL